MFFHNLTAFWKKGILHAQIPYQRKQGAQFSFVTGLFHPVIVVPTLTLSQQEWYYVLSHETAHYLHGDTIYIWLIELLRVVFWWNPLFYLFHRKIGIYIEESADLLATELLDDMEKDGISGMSGQGGKAEHP